MRHIAPGRRCLKSQVPRCSLVRRAYRDDNYAHSARLFEGSVEGCGTGTFTVLTRETIEPSGTAQGRWVIPALGSEDLSQLTGTGTSTGSYAPDGTGSGQLSGRLLCRA